MSRAPGDPAQAGDALAVLLSDPQNRLIVGDITGTDDPQLLRSWWDDWCRHHLGVELVAVGSVVASVGVAAQWVLADGRRVFAKQLRAGPGEERRLSAVNEVLRRLRAQGFPCPGPLAGPAPCGPGLALAQTWEDGGMFNDGHDPVQRRAQAEALAALHGLTEAWNDLEALGTKALPALGIWGPPHSPLFDFGRPGGAWIDAAGRRVRAALEARVPRPLVTHHDWSSQHLKWRMSEGGPPRLATLYDTDSFVNADEALSVGFAAATFPARWDPGHDPWPTPVETEAFVAEYAAARGPGFTDDDRRAALAYAGFSTGYLDKCLHSQATLEGASVVLREYRDDDVDAIASWAGDPATTRGMGPRWQAGRTRSQIAEAVGRIRTGEAEGVFFVIADPDGSYLGGVDLTSVDRRAGTAVLSLVIGRPEHRGRGKGTEAVRLMARYGFRVVRLRQITLRVDPANPAAVRCYEKAGFVPTGPEDGLAGYRLDRGSFPG